MAAENERSANPLWESWIDTLKAAGSPVSAYASLVEQWGGAAGSAANPADAQTPPGEPAPTAAPAAFLQAFLGGQQALLRMTELAAESMRSLGIPGSGFTAGPAASLEHALGDMSAKLGANPLLNGLDLWTASAAQYHRTAAPWTELMQRSIGVAAALGGPSGAGDPLGDALERSFGLLANFPGLNQELPALLSEAAVNATALAGARESYRAIMAATWQRAFEEITREVLRRSADRQPVESPGALLSLSTGVADRVFVETFNSERYIEAQQRLSTALADQRKYEAKVVDLFARFGHFPTRRDHDELLREISGLRREVHALKRTLRSPRPAPPQAAPEPGPPHDRGAPDGTAAATAGARPRARGKAARTAKSPPKKRKNGE
jgi:Poly(R)-hydroxyalkanoic acid synthase subunit (PHA_synth_III_E)